MSDCLFLEATFWQGSSSYFLGEKAVLLSLRVFTLKRSTAGDFSVRSFRVLNLKHMTVDIALFQNWYLLRVKEISSHARKDLGVS